MIAGFGLEVVRYYENIGVALVQFPDPTVAARLLAQSSVDYIEPDLGAAQLDLLPGSASTNSSAASTGTRVAAGAMMSMSQTMPWGVTLVRAPDAWPYSTGSVSRILIVDTGHERGHEDLPLVPLGNCMGAYGACDDPVYSPSGGIPHGTHVTGTAVALNNGIGVVGVAYGVPSSNLYVYSACDPTIGGAGCPFAELIGALNWAVPNLGSQGVVNMSLGGPTYNQAFANAVAAASAAGHVLVASAGNDAVNALRYPAAYSNVIGVAAVLPTKAFAATAAPCPFPYGGSNWGAHVDFVAPWYALSTVPNSSYADETTPPYWCGTSMAAPHVTGLAALVRTRYPSWSASSVFYRMRDTAEPLGPIGWDDHFGFGLIRAHLAVAFDRPVATPTIVAGKPRLSWPAIPFATEYRIYRRVTPTACPTWALWATVGGTSYTDASTNVTSFYGYDSAPTSQAAVSYYVTAFAEGVETVYYQFVTYLPNGALVC